MKRPLSVFKTILIAVLAISGLLSMSIAQADDSGQWYVGFAIGQSNYGSDIESGASLLNQELTNAGYTNTVTYSKTETGYVPRFGYRFNQYFSLEGNYFNMGSANVNAAITYPVSGNLSVDIKLTGFGIDAVGSYPLNDMWSLFANGGIIEASVKDSVAANALGNGAANNESSNNTTYDIGGGVQMNATNNWSLRLGYMQYHNVGDNNTTGSGNVNYAYLGAFYYF